MALELYLTYEELKHENVFLSFHLLEEYVLYLTYEELKRNIVLFIRFASFVDLAVINDGLIVGG